MHHGHPPPDNQGLHNQLGVSKRTFTRILWVGVAVAVVLISIRGVTDYYAHKRAEEAFNRRADAMLEQFMDQTGNKTSQLRLPNLLSQYDDDAEVAQNRYEDRRISLIAKIDTIQETSKGRVKLVFSDEDSEWELRCRLASPSQADDLSEGDEVEIVGKLTRMSEKNKYVELRKCEAE